LAENGEPTSEQSRAALERKAKLYEKLKAEGGLDIGEEGEEDILVDFARKAYDSRGDDEDSWGGPPARPAHKDEDPWVEYVDEFGRSRVVRKSELPELPPQPRAPLARGFVKAGETSSTSDETSLLSKDMMIERERLEWEQSAQDELAGKGPPAHYDSKREVRNLGVGFYQLSQDDSERGEQLKELKGLRNETKQARESEKARKDRHAQRLEERRKLILAKAKKRKGDDGSAVVETNEVLTNPPELDEDKLRAIDDFVLDIRQDVERSAGINKKRQLFGDLMDNG
jgi:hypothetical protein